MAGRGQVRARIDLPFGHSVEIASPDPDLIDRLTALFEIVRKSRPEFTSIAVLEALTGLSLRPVFDADPGPAHALVPLLERTDHVRHTGAGQRGDQHGRDARTGLRRLRAVWPPGEVLGPAAFIQA